MLLIFRPQKQPRLLIHLPIEGLLGLELLDNKFRGKDDGALGQVAAEGPAFAVAQDNMGVDKRFAVLQGDIALQGQNLQGLGQIEPFILPGVLVIIADPAWLTAPMALTSPRVMPISWQMLVKACQQVIAFFQTPHNFPCFRDR